MQITSFFTKRTAVVSGGPSAANARGVPTRPAAPARESVVRKRRRVCVNGMASPPSFACSRLQFAFHLVEKAPIGTLRDDLAGYRLYHAGLVQPQRVEADRVFG